jgi:fido (protein-threonine AMPylation protein)
MPDEVPVLVEEFLAWLTQGVRELLVLKGEEAQRVEHALALACNAHTRLVFVHPFGDGNGRLARTLSALVLHRVGLPAPMFDRQARSEYMEAVSQATIHMSYKALAIPGDKPAVSHRAIVVCIELESYCAGIAMADVEGQIVHVVMEPVR